MGELDKLKIRLEHQNLAKVAREAGIGRATIYRLQKATDCNVSLLDKVNGALDKFNVMRVSDDQPERSSNGNSGN